MKFIETYQGYVEAIGDSEAELSFVENGRVRYYAVSILSLLAAGIEEGDSLYVDVYENEHGERVGQLRRKDPQPMPPADPNIKYMSPDELRALSDDWQKPEQPDKGAQ